MPRHEVPELRQCDGLERFSGLARRLFEAREESRQCLSGHLGLEFEGEVLRNDVRTVLIPKSRPASLIVPLEQTFISAAIAGSSRQTCSHRRLTVSPTQP